MSQNPPLHPDVLRGLQAPQGLPQPDAGAGAPAAPSATAAVQAELPLASPGIQRWVWRSRFGEMLIETAGEEVFVNGQRVQRHVG